MRDSSGRSSTVQGERRRLHVMAHASRSSALARSQTQATPTSSEPSSPGHGGRRADRRARARLERCSRASTVSGDLAHQLAEGGQVAPSDSAFATVQPACLDRSAETSRENAAHAETRWGIRQQEPGGRACRSGAETNGRVGLKPRKCGKSLACILLWHATGYDPAPRRPSFTPSEDSPMSWKICALAAALGIAVVGCGSAPVPAENVTQAKSSISAAEAVGAQSVPRARCI